MSGENEKIVNKYESISFDDFVEKSCVNCKHVIASCSYDGVMVGFHILGCKIKAKSFPDGTICKRRVQKLPYDR